MMQLDMTQLRARLVAVQAELPEAARRHEATRVRLERVTGDAGRLRADLAALLAVDGLSDTDRAEVQAMANTAAALT